VRIRSLNSILLSALVIASLVTLIIPTMLQLKPVAAETDLIGYWKFDEGSGSTAADSSGMSNNGTIINGATWVDGKVGNALRFDGVDDYVYVPTSSSLNDYSGGLTLMAWIKTDTVSTYQQHIIAKGNGFGYPGEDYAITLQPGDDLLFFIGGTAAWVVYGVYPDAVTPNKWYHVAATWNGTEWAIYVNGTLKASGGNQSNSPLNFSSSPLCVGREPGWPSTSFDGLIDEVRIYNRALSSSEIFDAYAGEVVLFDNFERNQPWPWYQITGYVRYAGQIWQGTGRIAIEDGELCDITDSYWYNVYGVRNFPLVNANFDASVSVKIMPDSAPSTNVGLGVGEAQPGENEDQLWDGELISFGYDGYYKQWVITKGGQYIERISGALIDRGEWARFRIRKIGVKYEFYVNDQLIRSMIGPDSSKINSFQVSNGVGVHWEGGTHVHYDNAVLVLLTPEAPDITPPVSSVNPIDNYWQIQVPITITATASDPSGVENVELWYRSSPDNSAWSAWKLYNTDKNGADGWSWSFSAPDRDGYYEFYSVGTDTLGNREAKPGEADAKCAFVDAKEWFPYYFFSKDEPNLPCSFFFDGDGDVKNNPSNYDSLRKIGILVPYYAYIHPVADKNNFTIQYWLYYANEKCIGGHPHDWEPMLVLFNLKNLSKPKEIGWGRHGTINYGSYDSAPKDGTHPFSFVARDTHANYDRLGPSIGDTRYTWIDKWVPGGVSLDVKDFNLYLVGNLIDENPPRPTFPPSDTLYHQYLWLRGEDQYIHVQNQIFLIKGAPASLLSLLDARPFLGSAQQPEFLGGWWPGYWPGYNDVPPWYVLDYDFFSHDIRDWVWNETRPNPHITETQYVILCPVDLHVYDSEERHVGENYETENLDKQIPGCKFDILPEGQFITIRDPSVDNYRIEIVGVENGKYSFSWVYWENGAPVYWDYKENVPITKGEIDEFIYNPWTSPRALKFRSLQKILEAGGDNRVIEHLQRSLDNLWIDDWHINQNQGFRVFLEEFISVNFMQIEMKCGRISMELKTTYLQTIDNLVEADKMLARTAIDEAKGLKVTNPLRQKLIDTAIAMAERKFGGALADVVKNRPGLAILEFGEAWEFAQLALKLAH